MNFAIPEGLAPEVYPLAWLVGTWRGPGFIDYPGIDERPVLVEATFSADGGPYLLYTATTWELSNPPASLEGEIDVATLEAAPHSCSLLAQALPCIAAAAHSKNSGPQIDDSSARRCHSTRVAPSGSRVSASSAARSSARLAQAFSIAAVSRPSREPKW